MWGSLPELPKRPKLGSITGLEGGTDLGIQDKSENLTTKTCCPQDWRLLEVQEGCLSELHSGLQYHALLQIPINTATTGLWDTVQWASQESLFLSAF